MEKFGNNPEFGGSEICLQRFGGEIREAFAPKVSQKLQPCNFGFAVLIEPCDVEVWAPPPLSLQRSFRFLHVS
jgi:hypothetical protein